MAKLLALASLHVWASSVGTALGFSEGDAVVRGSPQNVEVGPRAFFSRVSEHVPLASLAALGERRHVIRREAKAKAEVWDGPSLRRTTEAAAVDMDTGAGDEERDENGRRNSEDNTKDDDSADAMDQGAASTEGDTTPENAGDDSTADEDAAEDAESTRKRHHKKPHQKEKTQTSDVVVQATGSSAPDDSVEELGEINSGSPDAAEESQERENDEEDAMRSEDSEYAALHELDIAREQRHDEEMRAREEEEHEENEDGAEEEPLRDHEDRREYARDDGAFLEHRAVDEDDKADKPDDDISEEKDEVVQKHHKKADSDAKREEGDVEEKSHKAHHKRVHKESGSKSHRQHHAEKDPEEGDTIKVEVIEKRRAGERSSKDSTAAQSEAAKEGDSLLQATQAQGHRPRRRVRTSEDGGEDAEAEATQQRTGREQDDINAGSDKAVGGDVTEREEETPKVATANDLAKEEEEMAREDAAYAQREKANTVITGLQEQQASTVDSPTEEEEMAREDAEYARRGEAGKAETGRQEEQASIVDATTQEDEMAREEANNAVAGRQEEEASTVDAPPQEDDNMAREDAAYARRAKASAAMSGLQEEQASTVDATAQDTMSREDVPADPTGTLEEQDASDGATFNFDSNLHAATEEGMRMLPPDAMNIPEGM